MKNWSGIIVGVIIGLLISGLILLIATNPEEEVLTLEPRPTMRPMQIEIYGAIRRPGIYAFSQAATVNDLVEAAGGLSADADPEGSRLAARVYDGDRILIPTRSIAEITLTPFQNPKISSKINLNTATIAELMTLPGIGEKKAGEIVNYRETVGPFEKVEDLLRIDGFGEKTIDRFYDLITVD